MRILFITNVFPHPGQPTRGVFNYQMVKALAREHRVRVLTPVSWVEECRAVWSGQGPRAGAHGPFDGIEVHYPRYYYSPRVLRTHYGEFLWRSVHSTVRKLVREERPDVVLGYWAHPDGEVAVRTARLVGVPAVVMLGGSDALLLTRDPARRRCILNVLEEANAVVTVGQDLNEKVAELGVDRKKLHIVPRGVDLEHFSPGDPIAARHRLGIPAEAKVLLWVGRMVAVKGLEVLLEACIRLRDRLPPFHLCLVGDGPLRTSLEHSVQARGLADRVRFAGAQPHSQLGNWYRAADLVVLPSHSEGVPNVLREALACGTPFVASQVGGIPEIAKGPVNRLVPPGNPEALAEGITVALQERATAGPLRFAAGSWEESARELVRVMERVGVARVRETPPTLRREGVREKRVLFVSYVFPPVGGAGVQRTTKFVKYLPRHGWQASVLTVANPSVPAFDHSLETDIPPETIVRRGRTWEPGYALKAAVGGTARATRSGNGLKRLARSLVGRLGRFLLQPDPQILWFSGALREGKRLLRTVPHDAIVVSGPPFSSFLIGAALSRWSGLPLVLDYRDEWSLSSAYWENRRPDAISQFLQEQMQRWAVRQACVLLATTRCSMEALAAVRDRARSRAEVRWIYNGYDPDDFPPNSTPARAEKTRYRLVYTGTLWELTSVAPLLEAVRRLAVREPTLAARLELVFAGRRVPTQQRLVEQLAELPCSVVEHPYLDHDRSLELLRSASAVCALLSDLPGAGRVVPAKIFEYMAARRPILAIAPPGELWDLLKNDPHGVCRTPADIEGIATWLTTELQGAPAQESPSCADWDCSRYSRERQAAELAGILDSFTVG